MMWQVKYDGLQSQNLLYLCLEEKMSVIFSMQLQIVAH